MEGTVLRVVRYCAKAPCTTLPRPAEGGGVGGPLREGGGGSGGEEEEEREQARIWIALDGEEEGKEPSRKRAVRDNIGIGGMREGGGLARRCVFLLVWGEGKG